MNDMSSVIVPKSDQINADDLIAGPMTITIREVQIRGGQEQPVSIYFDGSDKAFRPCKSMSRVLVQGWGADANKYIGRSLTLYRDPTVKWAGLEVGGIRISHMSHIDSEKLMMLTATKGSRKPHKVWPLEVATKDDVARKWATAFVREVGGKETLPDLENFVAGKTTKLDEMKAKRPELHTECEAAIGLRRGQLSDGDFTDDTTTDTPAQDFLPRIASAADAADLGLVEQDYRAVMMQLPKADADAVEAALKAKRAELGEG